LAQESAELLKSCGVDADVVFSDTRKLVLESADKKFSFFLVKPSDVPTYVEYGIADIGIVGKDTLLEEGKDLYEMLDLKFEPCKLCVAGYPAMRKQLTNPHLRVATKYVNTARQLYASRGEDIEIIPLHGSIELAPVTGLSDVIFDIVQTGSTLRANGLEVLEEVYDISARLVANKVSLKTKADVLLPLIDAMRQKV
jgi:ATP phosphoribosyltransferase